MAKKPDATQKTSRRKFAKSVAAAFVATPIAASLSSCDNKATTGDPRGGGDGPGTDSHVPPIIITDGSFIIESDDELEFTGNGGTGPGGKQRKKYKRKNAHGEPDVSIACVVVRKKENGPVLFCQSFKPKDCYIEIYWKSEDCKKDDGTPCPEA